MKPRGKEIMSGWRRRRNLWILFTLVLAVCAYLFLYVAMPAWTANAIAERSPVAPVRDPGSHGLVFEHVSFQTLDRLTLAAWWIPAQTGAKKVSKPKGTVVMSHGVGNNRGQILDRAGFLARNGYQVLLFDLRGHGASSPAYLSGGRDEALDYAAAQAYLKASGRIEKPMVLFGLSLSAMAALRSAAADSSLIAGVIADCPLPKGRSWVSQRTMGGWLIALPGFFDACLKAYNRRTGLELKLADLDLVPAVKGLRLPALFYWGEKDDLVRPQEARDLFAATGTRNKRLVYIPEAGHDEAYRRFRVMYERALLEFLENLRTGFPKPRTAS
jgi:uncharacterized protein